MSEIEALDMMRQAAKGGFPGSTGFVSKNAQVLFGLTDDESLFNGIANRIETEIAERYMLAPVDADGVPIHMGDSVEGELIDGSTVKGTVCAFHLYDDEPDSVYIRVNVGGMWAIKALRLTRCRHAKQRTLEDVLADFSAKVLNSGHQWGLDSQGAIGECADEIRELLGGAE